MKKLLNKYPVGFRFVIALLLFALALILSNVLNRGVVKAYFPYTAVILLGIATWILYKSENKSLSELGLNLRVRNLLFLPLGLLIGAIALLAAKYARAIYAGESFVVSDAVDYKSILLALYYILPTVAVEEFLFRGYVFKKTIEKSNVVIANIIFSILFMSIHVLDESVMQNLGHMIMLMIIIPVGHIWFSIGLLKSKTLFFPIGLHLGNNWASRHLITNSNSGETILYTVNNVSFDTWPSFIGSILIFNGVFLIVTFIIWKWDKLPLIRRSKNV